VLPTDGKTANGIETEIRWSLFNPLGNFLFKTVRLKIIALLCLNYTGLAGSAYETNRVTHSPG
jgi:hypothetical protein